MMKVLFKSIYKDSEWMQVGTTDKTLDEWIDEHFEIDEDETNYFLSMGELKLEKEDKKMAKIGNINVKVLKKHENDIIGTRVELTRKMTIKGVIIYAVVITNMNTGRHYKILTFPGIQGAFDTYKQAIA